MEGAPAADEFPPVKVWLLDTGPLVAVLNRRDPRHQECAEALGAFSGTLVTTGAVVTEAMHFVGGLPGGSEALAGLLDDAQVDVRDCFAPGQLYAAAKLMKKYEDCPMDFADATLVLLAEETGFDQILTLDARGFRTYRYRGTRRFGLVLSEG